jgi:NADPH2:quinone reductase
MKSVILTKYGAPEVLKVKELKDLEPSNKQVKIKVHYAGINFAEIMARMKLYPGGPKPGSVLGGEVSGVIDEIGEQIIMSKFVYYNNDFTVNGNPTVI